MWRRREAKEVIVEMVDGNRATHPITIVLYLDRWTILHVPAARHTMRLMDLGRSTCLCRREIGW